jgi:hydrogenase maturation protease
MMADWYRKRIVVLGCGNILFGDDGFGPAVAQYCQAHHGSPPDVCILDAGTSVRNVLFDILLSDRRPSRIVIVDAMDGGHEPGELFEPDVDSLPRVKIDDFSMHQLPTSNLLRHRLSRRRCAPACPVRWHTRCGTPPRHSSLATSGRGASGGRPPRRPSVVAAAGRRSH